MSTAGKFRYVLEPVLLMRQWDRDALLADLAAANAALDKAQGEVERLELEIAAVTQEWQQAATTSTGIAVHKIAILSRYLDDLIGRRDVAQQLVRLKEREREGLAEETMNQQKAVEAIELHKDDMRAIHRKAQANAALKEADDHWSTLQEALKRHD